jgi:ActR/RegA family two-component response regulator
MKTIQTTLGVKTMSKPLILLTDDDPATLAAYRRHLRRHFRLVTAGDGREAIDIIQAEMPDAVVSDLHMPMMNGISLLTEVRRMVPKALRILLTGQPDLVHAIEAINTGEVFRLLVKPCPSGAIVAAIEDGLGRSPSVNVAGGLGGIATATDPTLTVHASTRMQQRAIPPIMIEWLMRFGAQRWSRGASVYEFDKDSRRRLRRHIGQRLFSSVEQWLGAYVVVGGEQRVVTAGWRQRRRHR